MLASKNPTLQAKPDKPTPLAGGKSAARPAISPNPTWARLALNIQPKLKVSTPDDPLEREADAAAEQVMRMPNPPVPTFSAAPPGQAQRQCAACAEEEEAVQRKAKDGSADAAPPLSGNPLHGLGGGRPLDGTSRAFFEPRFGTDFSAVRIHTDENAATSAQAIQAKAYTYGRDIVFGSGAYTPERPEGQRLLAHELAHVVQQSDSPTTATMSLSRRPLFLGREREPQPPQPRDAASETPQASDEEDNENFWEWLIRLFQEVIRVLRQVSTLPTPLARETPPSGLPRNCLTFGNQTDLDTRKAHWASVIAAMPTPDVVLWIIGVNAPPAAPAQEASQQKDCMLAALRIAATAPGSSIHLPASIWSQGHRGFSHQSGIWQRKFEFRGDPFDRISDHARNICGSLLLPTETRWTPNEPRHRLCWNVAPLPRQTPPSMPAGARALTDDERQQEILQASSAPGISRHHWGSDFDLFSVNPEDFEAGHRFADEYSWLMRNASTYGFIQSFTATSAFMTRGYMEERWHWSYWPLSQALLEFAQAHQSDIQTELMSRWGSSPQFSFIRRHWREYMFNVNERARF